MSKKKISASEILTTNRIKGIAYIIFAIVLILIPTVFKCQCTGWDIINPLCWLAWLGCNLAKLIFGLVGVIGGLILILLAIKNFITG